VSDSGRRISLVLGPGPAISPGQVTCIAITTLTALECPEFETIGQIRRKLANFIDAC